MFKKILFSLFLFVAFSFAAHAEEAAFNRVMKNKAINCGYFLWPPYVIKDANTGKLSGLNYDVMNAIGKNLGLKLNWTAEIGVGDAVAALESNKIDVMCASLWANPVRTQTMTLSVPTFYSIAYAFVRKDDARFDGDLDKANAKGIKVSVIDGDYTQDLAAEKLPNATMAALPQIASGSDLLLQIVAKKADIVFSDEGLINDFMKTNPGTLRKVAGVGPVRYYGDSLAVKRGEYHLKNMLDGAIIQLTNDGAIAELTKKYSKQYKAVWYPPTKTFDAR